MRTFLFTDIEGSTRLWERYNQEMAEALMRHDALLRSTVEEHGGKIFKTIGDAFCAAFENPRDGVEAASLAQRKLLSEKWLESGPLRVRMALHTGEAQSRGGDFFGSALSRVARMLAAAHGGQVLLSEATHEAISEPLPEGCTLSDLGSHRLRDLQRPERIFQLCHPELPGEFPPLRTLQAFANNLPSLASSFIGREKEIAAVKGLLAVSRLLTLTGAGGSGKTRLALQAGAEVLERYRDGVWLIDFAPLADPALVVQTAAATLGLRGEPGRAVEEAFSDYVARRSLLLILDNCEHIVEAVAALIEMVIQAAPQTTVMATSREALQMAGETTYTIPPLSAPDPERLLSSGGGEDAANMVNQFEAVRLFVERAGAIAPGFAVGRSNARGIAQICHRLDGIPLAIELAAARIKVLSVDQIATRLNDRFRLLTWGSRTALRRQQTLRAAIDWSYDLLTQEEQELFVRLSIFAGGWTLEAAEAVCISGDIQKHEVFELLARLVNKSLAVFDPSDGEEDAKNGHREARYRMLETMREYGRQRIRESGSLRRIAADHAKYFLAFAERAAAQLTGPNQVEWYEQLHIEQDNLRAAVEWFLSEGGDPSPALRMAEALRLFWWLRGYFAEGRHVVTRALEAGAAAPPLLRARVMNVGGVLAWFQADYARLRSLCGEALEIARQSQDSAVLAASLILLGSGASFEREEARASAFLEEARLRASECGDPWLIAQSLHHSAIHALHTADADQARAFAGAALAVARGSGDKWTTAIATRVLGFTAIQQSDYSAARRFLDEALGLYKQLHYMWGIATCMLGRAKIAALQGEMPEAAGLYGAAKYLRDATGAPLPPQERADQDRLIAQARTVLGEAEFAQAFEEGRGKIRAELSGQL